MRTLKQLRFYIEKQRQLLEHATRTQNIELMIARTKALTVLYSEFYDESCKAIGLKLNDSVLVFSQLFPDGVVLDREHYRALCQEMTLDDLNTHQAVPVDEDMTEQIRDLISVSKKRAV